MRALIRQHDDTDPPGLLGEWAQARGIPFEVSRSDRGEPLPDLDERPFIASLGSRYGPLDVDVAAVRDELELVERAIRRRFPVLGLCYGAQVLAKVLGGEVEPAPEPEIAWRRVESLAPELIDEGPWLEWHYQRFTLPPGARELARSARALQAFAYGPHLGVQFHPEATVETALLWARSDRERLATVGIEDGEALAGRSRAQADRARAAAMRLFDGFWRGARDAARRGSSSDRSAIGG
jgi:GMP synthase-like glutamine amidotransferase